MSAAFRVSQARMLLIALEGLLELQVPLPPRRVSSRETTLLISLRVAREELDQALSLLRSPTFHTVSLNNSRYRSYDMADGSRKLESKKARAAAKKTDDEFAKKLLSDFDAQPAQITNEQLDAIEADFLGLGKRRSRRAALAAQAMSGIELTKAVTGDRETALAFTVAEISITEYASHLREFADMMKSASARIGIALCSREDMRELYAEAENSKQEVGLPRPAAAKDDEEFVNAPPSAGKNSFALRIRDDSMVNTGPGFSFPLDSIIIVDPSGDAHPGDHVIVKLSTAREPIFRMLDSDGQQRFLKPLNPRYPTTPVPADARIVGVVISVQTETWHAPKRQRAPVAA
ncbi:MAG TPA: S24 family peptidase [Steroidobacteraceae bacterium]|jgi:hypothetical protein|nr:S24 family peptidase [Steroidobacteraceae bacterium]